jgi:hypothetical protein
MDEIVAKAAEAICRSDGKDPDVERQNVLIVAGDTEPVWTACLRRAEAAIAAVMPR